MKSRILGLAISVSMIAAPSFATQKPKGGQPKPHAVSKTVVKAQPPTHGKSSVKLQAKSGAKPVKVKSPVKTKSSVKVHAKSTPGYRSTPGAVGTTGVVGTWSPVQQKLQRNTNLAAKLSGRLPAGTDLMSASAGFRSLGQFVSTVNASHNHNLSFEGLKQRILYDGMSLGQAMKDMRYSDAPVRRR